MGAQRFDRGNWTQAGELFEQQATAPELADFLTLDAYEIILQKDLEQSKM